MQNTVKSAGFPFRGMTVASCEIKQRRSIPSADGAIGDLGAAPDQIVLITGCRPA